MKISKNKYQAMERLSTKDHIIAALAIDQRGALKKMLKADDFSGDVEQTIVSFKELVSEELTLYSSSILLDPEYGLPAAKVRDEEAGLLLAYEQTGYDATEPGRFPDLIHDMSAFRIRHEGADGVKFLLYYDIDEGDEVNERKHAFVERIGSECVAEDIPFYLELLSYDAKIADNSSAEFAKVKPRKVIEMMKEFSKPQYHVDVLKMEVPVNMRFVEGFAENDSDILHTKEEALQLFKDQSDATHLPYIFLSAGVSAQLFQDTIEFAYESGAKFNGVLCGRATWKGGVPVFVEHGEEKAREWLRTQGRQNIEELNEVINRTAQPWTEKLSQ